MDWIVYVEIGLDLITSVTKRLRCICFQFAYKDGFEYMKTTLETEELDAPVGQVTHNMHGTAASQIIYKKQCTAVSQIIHNIVQLKVKLCTIKIVQHCKSSYTQ